MDRLSIDLLDYIWQKVGCSALSDLHTPQYSRQIAAIVQELLPEDCPLAMWNEAINYLLAQPAAYSDAVAARAYLLEKLLS